MGAGLTLLSDSELTTLRERIAALSRGATMEQRLAASQQLELIDLERERRLSAPLN
jgi:hypothetical protein